MTDILCNSATLNKVFSFCLYGSDYNYYNGLLENIKIIRDSFPDFEIFVYKGICDRSWVLPEGVTVIETHRDGASNTLCRYLPLKMAEVGFVRDADSRITERDQWCIKDFLESPYSYHTIRDHIWCKSRIMGGLFGWKKSLDMSLQIPPEAAYGFDEAYLASFLYPLIVPELLVHTNLIAFHGENSRRLPEMTDPADFVGNKIWDGRPKFTSEPDPAEVANVLRGQDQHELVQWIADRTDPTSVPYDKRSGFFDAAYIANYYLGDTAKAQYWISQFEFAEITPHIQSNAKYLLPRLGRIVASFDSTVEPAEGEVVIYYGNYPDWHLALPCSNKIYRHISRFFEVEHDKVLYHSAWEPVDCIYIINLEERFDRYCDTLLALAAVKAPLHRVRHHKVRNDGQPPYFNLTKNHADILDHFCKSGAERALILEDDFVFIDDQNCVWSTLQRFWDEALPHDLCFLSLSKHGRREPNSKVTIQSLQPCTTAAGYFVHRDTAFGVLAVVSEGLDKMQSTGDHHNYCIDRYWSKLPSILCLRPKIGFQRPSYSNIIQKVSAHLD